MSNIKKRLLMSIAAVSVASWTHPARADVVDLSPTADNTIYQFDPTTGEFPTSNGIGFHMFCGNNLHGQARRGLLRFSIADSIPQGSTISSASLRLSMSRTIAGPTTVKLHRAAASWGEAASQGVSGEGGGGDPAPGDAEWRNRFHPNVPWANVGGDFSSTVSASQIVAAEEFYTFTGPGMAADVQAWLDAPANDFGWFIIGDESDSPTAKAFDSREHPLPEYRPVLYIEFTPPDMGCVGDYNQDGGVDGADVQSFFEDWEGGNAAADLNQDGGVDGADVDFFFGHWEAGC